MTLISRLHLDGTEFTDWLSGSNLREAEKWQDGALERQRSKISLIEK